MPLLFANYIANYKTKQYKVLQYKAKFLANLLFDNFKSIINKSSQNPIFFVDFGYFGAEGGI